MIAELVGLGIYAMKAQEQSQRAKPQICGVGIPILHRHCYQTLRSYPAALMFLPLIPKLTAPRTRAPSAQVRKRFNAAVW
ncbi:hypothetical protein [Bradyrhizobium lablabi]|uniref:hypothetical protein n=1 Tax=Bradyrhizobium lablabi TaxID=722472 RepID=UPI001BAB61AB|nr:hypothetical protein [Bradyrhizobium lablabi]MBR0696593.1 hypothetical protein [Bradyrhizobium lablabi]